MALICTTVFINNQNNQTNNTTNNTTVNITNNTTNNTTTNNTTTQTTTKTQKTSTQKKSSSSSSSYKNFNPSTSDDYVDVGEGIYRSKKDGKIYAEHGTGNLVRDPSLDKYYN